MKGDPATLCLPGPAPSVRKWLFAVCLVPRSCISVPFVSDLAAYKMDLTRGAGPPPRGPEHGEAVRGLAENISVLEGLPSGASHRFSVHTSTACVLYSVFQQEHT